jgi:hypothetical protein
VKCKQQILLFFQFADDIEEIITSDSVIEAVAHPNQDLRIFDKAFAISTICF